MHLGAHGTREETHGCIGKLNFPPINENFQGLGILIDN